MITVVRLSVCLSVCNSVCLSVSCLTLCRERKVKVTQNIMICPWIMSNHSVKFHKDLISSFWVILLTDRQTQTRVKKTFFMEVITRVTQKITLLNVNFLQLCTRYSSLQASMETDWKGRPSWEISALNINNRCLSPSRLTAVVMFSPVMWSETVGLRTRPVWVQKKIGLGRGLGLARLV